jgi:hypothetical protein
MRLMARSDILDSSRRCSGSRFAQQHIDTPALWTQLRMRATRDCSRVCLFYASPGVLRGSLRAGAH